MSAKAIWTVIPRSTFNLEGYVELPFGRFNEALPFLQAFLSSAHSESDIVKLDGSSRGKLERAIVKVSGIKLEMRSAKKDGTKLDKPVPVVDSATVKRAMDKLAVSLVRYAKDGDIEVMAIRRNS